MDSKQVKGSEALLLSLVEEGVDTIFGYPGGAIMPLYDELYNFEDRLNHILVRHEQGAVHAAEGYARATGKVGVCFATAGPGATNMVTGITDAMMDSTPLVCITAQVTAEMLGKDFFQEADTISITIPITKWSYQITKASEVASIMAKAFDVARSGRPGPVLISFTKNAQVEMTDFLYVKHKKHTYHKSHQVEESIAAAAELINSSAKPLMVIGQGVILSGAEKSVLKLAEKGNIPFATTLLGISSVPFNHPLFMGNVGMHGNLAPNYMTQECDLLIGIGMRFSDRVTGDTSKYAPNAKIIHIELDKAEINKNIKASVAVHSDAKLAADLLLERVFNKVRGEWMGFAAKCNAIEKREIVDKLLPDNGGELSMAQVIDKIASAGKGEAIIVTDVGQNQMMAARYSKFLQTRSMITSGGLGTMGFGLPAAMGAKLGSPDREVVVVTGDGGLQMSIQELGTIMQSGIAVKILLLNNSFLGMVRQWQELFFKHRYSFTDMDNPDFLKIAEAYRIPAKRVSMYGELDMAIKEMLDAKSAYLLEVVVRNEENVFPMVPPGASLSNLILDENQ
jgi:acetolactate synthase-1/2/3 large subunit